MRIRTITRTIATNNAKVVLYDKYNKEVVTKDFTCYGNYSDEELEKVYKAQFKGNEFYNFVAIADVEKVENLYSMTEEDFILNSVIVEK